MKKFFKADQVKHEIDAYEAHFSGSPLVIGIDSKNEYVTLLGLLRDDFGKQIVRMSDFCTTDFPPNPAYTISEVSSLAKEKSVVWVGSAQAIMLYGQNETEKYLINLLGSSFKGPVTVLCPFCCSILENIGRKYEKLGYNIVIASSNERKVPTIYLSPQGASLESEKTIHGIKQLLYTLEEGVFQDNINITSTCKLSYLSESMYPVCKGKSAYEMLCLMEPGIAINTTENMGAPEQWKMLFVEVQKAGDLSRLCDNRICPVSRLANSFGNYFSEDDETRFICFIALKVFCSNGNEYLNYCLQKSNSIGCLESRFYDSILDIPYNDNRFNAWIRQRRQILALLDENNTLMADFCQRATVKGKDVLWYLCDETDEERSAIVHALSCYQYSFEYLCEVLKVASPSLFAYIQCFVFDEFNTKTMGSDSYVRDFLTNYFQQYKLQKIMNRQDVSFVELVEKEATTRSFTKLQARSAIVKKIDKKNVQPYFFDALGVEFLAFIQAKAEQYGLQFECLIGHCNLPSITSKNKEFYDAFPKNSILKEDKLDELKHHGTKYDFRFTTEPLHIFDELTILDRDLNKIRSALATGKCKRVVILSDHGASRLAVTYQSENDKLVLSEPGKHSGRCCPAEKDPNIPFVTYEDGFAVIANYERFKGSRKADVETHGGATLEEVIVPVIQLSLKSKLQQLFFVDSVVSCSPKEGSTIRLFANPPLKKPSMRVVGKSSYDGAFDGDEHNIIFVMRDIIRKGQYQAVIYEAGLKISELTFETKRQTGSNQLI
jgi:hypothetical protein